MLDWFEENMTRIGNEYFWYTIALIIIGLVLMLYMIIYYFKQKKQICSKPISEVENKELYNKICKK